MNNRGGWRAVLAIAGKTRHASGARKARERTALTRTRIQPRTTQSLDVIAVERRLPVASDQSRRLWAPVAEKGVSVARLREVVQMVTSRVVAG